MIKKKDVGWNGSQTEIAADRGREHRDRAALFNNNFRLKAIVTFKGLKHEVALGSDDNGVSLKIQVVRRTSDWNPGGTGVAGRG